jgi:hypothetical protein
MPLHTGWRSIEHPRMRTSIALLMTLAVLPACAAEDTELTGSAELELAEISTIRAFPGGIHGMAVNASGRLFFSDSFGALGNPRSVYFLDPPYTGAFTRTPHTGTIPAGLLFDRGFLFIADVATGTVRKINRRDQVVKQWTGVQQPWNLTRLPSGALLTVSNNGFVQRLNANLRVTTLFGGLDAPFGIASAGDGTIWVSEQGATEPGRVTRRSLTGAVLESIAYDWDNPEGLHVDANGDLWIAETGLGQILRYDGVELTVEGEGLGLPVVITGRDADSLLANSANLPAALLGIELGAP